MNSKNSGPDHEEEAERLLRSDSLFRELGIEPNFAPDHLAPPVDEDRLRRLIQRRLPRDEQREVCQLIAAFRPWYETWSRLVREEPPGSQE